MAEEYKIHGKTAHKGNKAFDKIWAKVINDMLTGKISVLVVWKHSRLDRKLRTFQMMGEVMDAGGRVDFVTQHQLNDLTNMGGRISLKVQEEMSYQESKDKSDAVRIGKATVRRNGGNPGKGAWGYVSDGEKYNRKLTGTEQGRKYAPLIFERIAKGQSLTTVCDWFYAETGIRLWPTTLRRMIRNPTYKGPPR